MPGHSACVSDVHYLSRSVISAYATLRVDLRLANRKRRCVRQVTARLAPSKERRKVGTGAPHGLHPSAICSSDTISVHIQRSGVTHNYLILNDKSYIWPANKIALRVQKSYCAPARGSIASAATIAVWGSGLDWEDGLWATSRFQNCCRSSGWNVVGSPTGGTPGLRCGTSHAGDRRGASGFAQVVFAMDLDAK